MQSDDEVLVGIKLVQVVERESNKELIMADSGGHVEDGPSHECLILQCQFGLNRLNLCTNVHKLFSPHMQDLT